MVIDILYNKHTNCSIKCKTVLNKSVIMDNLFISRTDHKNYKITTHIILNLNVTIIRKVIVKFNTIVRVGYIIFLDYLYYNIIMILWYMYTCISILRFFYTYVCVCVCVCMCVCVCVCVYVYVYMYICVCVYVYVYMCICV